MSFATEVLIQTGIYVFVMVGSVLLLNFLTKGFILAYLQVKGSRGKFLLARVRTRTGGYYRKSEIKDDMLKYKNKHKEKKSISNIPEGAVYQDLGVNCIELDDDKDVIVDQTSNKFVEGHDANKVDDMIEKALQKPAIMDKKEIIIIILCILILVGVVATIFMLVKMEEVVNGLQIIGRV